MNSHLFIDLSPEISRFIEIAFISGPISILVLLIYISKRKEKEPEKFRW